MFCKSEYFGIYNYKPPDYRMAVASFAELCKVQIAQGLFYSWKFLTLSELAMSFRKKVALFAVIAAALICAFGAWIFNIVNSNAFYSEVASLSCSRMPLDLKIYKICLAFLDYDCAKEEGMHNIPSGGMPKFLDTLDAHLKKRTLHLKNMYCFR